MTQPDKIELLNLALRCVDLGFTTEQTELISRVTEAVRKKKGNFNLRDAAIIKAEVLSKYRPKKDVEFEELEEIENDRE